VLAPTEAAGHPHARARDAFVEVGGVTQPAPAPRFGRTPAAVGGAPSAGDPAVLDEWGLDPAQAAALAG
jgi:alpha-methylacyl-CoA racemase